MEFSKSRKYRDDEIFAIIINLSLTDKLGEHTYEELLKSNPESLKQILHTNKDELQRRVVTAESDFFGEKGNDRDKGESKENGERRKGRRQPL